MSNFIDLSSAEQRAYELIAAENGLPQSQLWKALDADSRKGSRLAKSLAENGLIERNPTTHNGQRTYLLTPTDEQPSNASQASSRQEGVPLGEPPVDPLTDREERALSLITENGGMYQSEFWKAFEVSSRTGSRIATNLADKGEIKRVETTHHGRRTYYLSAMPRDLDFSLLMAGDMISPTVSMDGNLDPVDSEEFTQWVLALARDHE